MFNFWICTFSACNEEYLLKFEKVTKSGCNPDILLFLYLITFIILYIFLLNKIKQFVFYCCIIKCWDAHSHADERLLLCVHGFCSCEHPFMHSSLHPFEKQTTLLSIFQLCEPLSLLLQLPLSGASRFFQFLPPRIAVTSPYNLI